MTHGAMLRTLDLFSGIGGMSLGLERTGGFETVAFVEIDPYCRRVLAKHWRGVPCFEDVRTIGADELAGLGRIDVICGGFPCQPVSLAGKRRGDKDERWLWPEYARLIRQVRPRWVLGENVRPLLSAQDGRLFGGILRDLARSGYDAEWRVLSAAEFGAPHLRERVFVLAYPQGDGKPQQPVLANPPALVSARLGAGCGTIPRHPAAGICECRRTAASGASAMADAESGRQSLRQTKSGRLGRPAGRSDPADGSFWTAEPGFRLLVDGFPGRLGQLRGYGNAVVPQVVTWIGYQILAAQQERR